VNARPYRLLLGLVVLLTAVVAVAPAAASPSGIVISEFRTRGPVGGNDEFIELRNAGSASVNIGGWAVQGCQSGTPGTASNRVVITTGVVLAPGQSYLVANTTSPGYSGAVAPDQTYGTGITDFAASNFAGIRLVNGATVIDGVGSPQSPCREGTGFTTPGTNGDNSFERLLGGTQDTDDNLADFAGPKAGNPQNFGPTGSDAAPTVTDTDPDGNALDVAQNANVTVTFSEPVTTSAAAFSLSCDVSGAHTFAFSSTTTTATLDPDTDFGQADTCTVVVDNAGVADVDGDDPPNNMAADFTFSFSTAGPTRRIYEIQGAGHRSPYTGQLVSAVPGVVVAERPNSLYVQDAVGDGNPATSDAILVFRNGLGALFNVGDAVLVSGRVTEFRPGGASSTNLSTTEIENPVVTFAGPGAAIAPTVVGQGGRVPPTEVIEDDATGDVETSGTFDPANDGIDFYESLEAMLLQVNDPVVVGPRNGFGEVWVLADDGANAFLRTTRGGILVRKLGLAPYPNDYTAGDFNPERIQLDDEIIPGLMPAVNVGDEFTGSVAGVLDYNFGNFELLLTAAPTRIDNGLVREVTSEPKKHDLTVATFNVENLRPTDPPAKFAELAELIVDHLRAPAIVALEEIQDNNGAVNDATTDATLTYQTLIAAIQAAGGPPYAFRQVDPVDDQDGGEPGGNIRVGFIFRTDVPDLEFVDRPGATPTTANSVVDTKKGAQLRYSPGRIDPTNPAFTASRKPLAVEFRYRKKTVFLIANHFNSKGGDQPLFGRFQPPLRSSEAQRHQQAQIVNDFVDQILAADRKADIVVLGDLNDFDFSTTLELLEGGVLTTLIETLPPSERYTYVFEGNSQSLDHILVSQDLAKFKPVYDVVHVNAEFAQQASDHDPQVARLEVHGTDSP
jgi:predicted extracellular nuclease